MVQEELVYRSWQECGGFIFLWMTAVVWLALIYILIVCMVLKTTCVCCERKLNVWPQNFSLQWNWNRFLSCWFFFTPLFTIRIGRQLSKISATVLSLQNMSSAICKYRIVWSSGRHYFQHNLSHIKMMRMHVWEGRQCLIRKESACLNNQDLAIPIQDSET